MPENKNQEECHKYDDIIDTKWPRPSLRGKMELNNRAKIFLPFAALTGFEAEIQKRKKQNEDRVNKTEPKINFITLEGE